MFESFVIPALAFHLAIISPAFQDLVPKDGIYSNTLSEWTLMDNVPVKAPIFDIKRVKNILQRRDASCDLNYKKVMGVTTRQITTDELYAATSMCRNEFYQGALADYRNDDPVFGDKILPFFQQAVITDILSNAYFGDISRAAGVEWSTNKFDGVFKWIAEYIAAGVIPGAQTITLAQQDLRANPAAAYAIVKGLYDRQNLMMRNMPNAEKAFYVSQSVLDGYQDYLISLGNGDANTMMMFANGVKIYSYKGIAIYPEAVWEPILAELRGGANYNAAILTLRGNFVLATDKNYGEGPDLTDALVIWYSQEHLAWKYQNFLKMGTQIALPEHIVVAV